MRKIYQTVSQILGDILAMPPDTVGPETKTDQLRYQELAAAALACEKLFHIEMEDERIGDFQTVADWVDYVRQRLAQRDDHFVSPTDQEREAWYYR